jgi:hypothetical protein
MKHQAYDDERGRLTLKLLQAERDRLAQLVTSARPRQIPVELRRLCLEDRAQMEERQH